MTTPVPLYYRVRSSSALYWVFTPLRVPPDVPSTMNCFLEVVTRLLREGGHFDEQNPSIVLCNQDWENVFEMKALHFSQIEAALASSLCRLENIPQRVLLPLPFSPLTVRRAPTPPRLVSTDPPTIRYRLSSRLLLLFQTAKVIEPSSHGLITLPEADRLLRAYVQAKQHLLIDSRNPLVVLVKTDPLGSMFRVKAFHLKQSVELMTKHSLLEPVVADLPPPPKKPKLI